jgi:hypothetical protein
VQWSFKHRRPPALFSWHPKGPSRRSTSHAVPPTTHVHLPTLMTRARRTCRDDHVLYRYLSSFSRTPLLYVICLQARAICSLAFSSTNDSVQIHRRSPFVRAWPSDSLRLFPTHPSPLPSFHPRLQDFVPTSQALSGPETWEEDTPKSRDTMSVCTETRRYRKAVMKATMRQ